MNEELIINPSECYRLAEQRATAYFQSLNKQMKKRTYLTTLAKDFQLWKQSHLHSSLFPFLKRKGETPKEYHRYLQWLDYTGKLHSYLDRSVSYIYLRDLGKSLNSPQTEAKIQQVVSSLKSYLTTEQRDHIEPFSMAGLYRMAQKEEIESTMIWLFAKLKAVSTMIPGELDVQHAKRKLIKIIAGVIMHVIDEMDEGISSVDRRKKLDEAIRLGYAYGLTYPFIDDLLDANILSPDEKQQYSAFIRTALITGVVPELGVWTGENKEFIRAICSELREAFEYIKAHQQGHSRKKFFEQAFVFFQAQEVDRLKSLANPHYTNEELFIPIILKSSSSRLIVRSVISAPDDNEFDDHTFFYGIYNQLADDFADMFDDMNAGAVTPYTYYLKYHRQRKDLINPFELYWTVISHLIHNVYDSDPKTREVLLDRAINGLKRFKEKKGMQKYNEIMELFGFGNSSFKRTIQKLVKKADNVDFFDKLLRDQMITILKKDQQEQAEFLETSKQVRIQLNHLLQLPTVEEGSLLNDSIIDAANYSLAGDGKRLRPIITWVMGVNEYKLDQKAIMPLVKSLEYMHTASLIFDDLPSQDDASTRRGRPTLHEVYNVAVAELTGLFLTQTAVTEQASLTEFNAKSVLQLIQYSSQTAADMCRGQAMDLDSKGKKLTLDQLNTMCFYKTGIAFEASLLMPAILAGASESDIQALKRYAYHAGIAFQIRDDLLDVEGDLSLLGKPIGQDKENNQANFVSILGPNSAKKAMWDHYCSAIEALREIPRKPAFLKHLLNYLVNRDH